MHPTQIIGKIFNENIWNNTN